jgi:hypothetical protein
MPKDKAAPADKAKASHNTCDSDHRGGAGAVLVMRSYFALFTKHTCGTG